MKRKHKKNRRKSIDTPHINYSFEISYDSIIDLFNYNEAEKNVINELYFLTVKKPHNSIIEILTAIDKYPHLPQLYNYLSVCLYEIDESEKALNVIKEAIDKFPDYLFNKINYAEHLLLNNRYTEIPKLFDNKFDLKFLFPNRNVFHISEVISFYYIMAHYFLKINMIDKCNMYYEIMHKLGPKDEKTKFIGKQIKNYLKDNQNGA